MKCDDLMSKAMGVLERKVFAEHGGHYTIGDVMHNKKALEKCIAELQRLL